MNTISSYNIKVTQATSTRTGEPVRNQFIIHIDNKIAFQSYNSLIAVYDTEHNILTLGKHFDYSVTTSRYLKQFICDYCYQIYRLIDFDNKSVKTALYKAIKNNIVFYDENLV